MGRIISLEIAETKQYFNGGEISPITAGYSVGSTHFTPEPVSPSDVHDLWLRYQITVPQRLKKIMFSAWYVATYNADSEIVGQPFYYTLTSDGSRGEQTAFTWTIPGRTLSEKTIEGNFTPGTYYLWLLYYWQSTNQSVYAGGVTTTFTGETCGSARIGNGTDLEDGADPSVYADGAWQDATAYVYHNGIWTPGG